MSVERGNSASIKERKIMTYLEKAKELRQAILPLLGSYKLEEHKRRAANYAAPVVIYQLNSFFDKLMRNQPEACDICNIVALFSADSKMSESTANKLQRFVLDVFEDWQLKDEPCWCKSYESCPACFGKVLQALPAFMREPV